jgi:hypothetical protein
MMTRIYACGPMGLPLAALGVVGAIVALGCVGAIFRARRSAPLLAIGVAAAVLGAVIMALGPVGGYVRRATAERLVASDPLLDDQQRAEYRQRAALWAAECVPVGGASGAAPLIAGCASIVVASRRRRR